MLPLLLWTLIFIASLFVLVKASDHFTDAAEKIGLYFGLPSFIVGVTIVAIGTSLPELITSIFAVLQNSSEIVVANVIGSNITNIFLIIGITALIAKNLETSYSLVHVDLPILVGSAFLLAIMVWDGNFTLGEAIISIIGMIIYLWYTIKIGKKHVAEETEKDIKKKNKIQKKSIKITPFLVLIASSFFIFIGAKYTIDSVIQLSQLLNIGKEIITVTAVALGTSLPELTVSLIAAKKGNAEMAIGNILGSNIFNTFAVMGIPALIGDLTIPNNILTFSLPVMIIATLMYFFITQDRKISRWEGSILLLFYVVFIAKIFNLF